MIEIYLRFKFPDISNLAKIIKTSDDQILSYELNPNVKIKYNGNVSKIPITTIEISSQGLRDRFYALQKTDNVKRVAFIGDSFVFGLGLDAVDTIPKQLENLLNKNSSTQYEVMNCGVIGYNLIQEVQFLKKKLIIFNPDLIIFLLTGNDVEREIKIPSNKLSNVIFNCSYLYQRIYIWRDKYFRERDRNAKSFINLAQRTSEAFKTLNQFINRNQKLLIVKKNFSPWMQGILDICREEDFQTLDFSPIFKSQENHILISKEDNHFNVYGAKLVAIEVFYFLSNGLLAR